MKKYLKLEANGNKTINVEEKKTDTVDEKNKNRSLISSSLELGFSVSLPIATGAIIGSYIDSVFRTSPKLTLSLLFTGLFIGCYNIYKIMREQ